MHHRALRRCRIPPSRLTQVGHYFQRSDRSHHACRLSRRTQRDGAPSSAAQTVRRPKSVPVRLLITRRSESQDRWPTRSPAVMSTGTTTRSIISSLPLFRGSRRNETLTPHRHDDHWSDREPNVPKIPGQCRRGRYRSALHVDHRRRPARASSVRSAVVGLAQSGSRRRRRLRHRIRGQARLAHSVREMWIRASPTARRAEPRTRERRARTREAPNSSSSASRRGLWRRPTHIGG